MARAAAGQSPAQHSASRAAQRGRGAAGLLPPPSSLFLLLLLASSAPLPQGRAGGGGGRGAERSRGGGGRSAVGWDGDGMEMGWMGWRWDGRRGVPRPRLPKLGGSGTLREVVPGSGDSAGLGGQRAVPAPRRVGAARHFQPAQHPRSLGRSWGRSPERVRAPGPAGTKVARMLSLPADGAGLGLCGAGSEQGSAGRTFSPGSDPSRDPAGHAWGCFWVNGGIS